MWGRTTLDANFYTMETNMSEKALFNIDEVENVVKAVGHYRRWYEEAESSLSEAFDLLFKLWQETKDPRIGQFMKLHANGYQGDDGKFYPFNDPVTGE